MVYLFLADGCEEVEALTPVDILRRGGVDVVTVGIGGRSVCSSHRIPIGADIDDSQVTLSAEVEGIVLPGGMPGTRNLAANQTVAKALSYCVENGLLIGAICAAPSILGSWGLLSGKKATVFPGFESEMKGAVVTGEGVVQDGTIITAKGMGVALPFGLALLRALRGDAAAEKVKASIQCAP